MITNQLPVGFTFGISVSFISWLVGMMINSILLKSQYYKRLSNLNFVKSKILNEIIGIKYFKWIVKNSFFKFLNQKIRLENKNTDLTVIRNEMTYSEISHLIGFFFVSIIAMYKAISISIVFGLAMMVPNVFLNLYPSLLQQENKRRIDRILKRKTAVKH